MTKAAVDPQLKTDYVRIYDLEEEIKQLKQVILKKALEKAGNSMAALSRATGIQRTTISYWVNGATAPQTQSIAALMLYLEDKLDLTK